MFTQFYKKEPLPLINILLKIKKHNLRKSKTWYVTFKKIYR